MKAAAKPAIKEAIALLGYRNVNEFLKAGVKLLLKESMRHRKNSAKQAAQLLRDGGSGE